MTDKTIAFSLLDLAPIPEGSSAREAFSHSLDLARLAGGAVAAARYSRWRRVSLLRRGSESVPHGAGGASTLFLRKRGWGGQDETKATVRIENGREEEEEEEAYRNEEGGGGAAAAEAEGEVAAAVR